MVMTEHDMTVGPCACGAWHEDGEVTEKPPVPSADELQEIYDHAEGGHDAGMADLWLAGYHARDAEVALIRDGRAVLGGCLDDYKRELNAEYADAERAEARIAELESSLSDALKAVEHWRAMYRESDLARVKAESQARELEAEAERFKSDSELRERLHSRASEALAKFMQARYDRAADPEACCGDYYGDVAVKVIERLEAEVAELFSNQGDILKAYTELAESAPRRTPELTERVRTVVRSWLVPSGARDFGPEMAVEPLTRDVLDEVFGKKEE